MAASAATLAKALVSTMLGILKSNFGIEMPRKLARRPQPLPPLKGELAVLALLGFVGGSVQSHSGRLPRTTDIPTFTAHEGLVFANGDRHVVARPTSMRARRSTTPLPARQSVRCSGSCSRRAHAHVAQPALGPFLPRARASDRRPRSGGNELCTITDLFKA